MDLEIIILSEVSQRKTNIICYHLYEKMVNIISIGEMQIKISVRYYFILTRMTIIKKNNNKC